ncbi:MAG: type II toxin-antitoxin system RelE/ParE family toxin [Simkania sp.]|nr:type II toxin-antitoxin system RelE/ParE family toxin [Simkania sp.]
MKYKILQTDEFEEWREDETAKSRVQIAKRIENIKEAGHFGDHKQIRDNVWELRWDNGRRVYYSLIPPSQVLLLLGGNKNGQSKDINQAKKVYKEWVYD